MQLDCYNMEQNSNITTLSKTGTNFMKIKRCLIYQYFLVCKFLGHG
jgi:hypothetical protein